MKRSFGLFVFRRSRLLFSSTRSVSNQSTKKYQGLREQFDENEARLYFDQWLKSLWFAPGGWTQSTRDDAITVTRRYVPFWNFSFYGSINASVRFAYTTSNRQGKNIVSSQQWHSAPMTMENVALKNLNIYAAQTLDRHHLKNFNISFDQGQITDLSKQENNIEQWTVDRDTAFHIGWDLTIVPQIKQLCVEQATQAYPHYSNHQTDSFHFDINTKNERLLYYPIYVINYHYGSQVNFTCLVDGITGQVTGDRQYSFAKVTLATLVGFYPMALTAIVSLGSLVDPSIGIALASLLTFKTSLPLAFIVSPLAGLYAKNYPKMYRERISQQQWQNYRSNATQFTYDFTSPFREQYQSYRQQQQQSSGYRRESRQQRTEYKARPEERETTIDLYNLLAVSRTATEREIKRAYLVKAKELHPDRNPGDKKAEELFKKVNQAYAILSDKYKREQYDKYGYESVKYN